MSFSEKITQLQLIFRLQHDLNNEVAGAEYTKEQEGLSEEGQKELDSMKSEYAKRSQEEFVLIEKIKADFPEAYKQHLTDLHTKLTSIQKYLSGLKEPLEFKHSLNKTLCKNLLSDLSKLMKDQKTNAELNWLFDVSERMLEEYRTE